MDTIPASSFDNVRKNILYYIRESFAWYAWDLLLLYALRGKNWLLVDLEEKNEFKDYYWGTEGAMRAYQYW